MNNKDINTLLSVAIVTTGIVVAVKNHKRDGFWKGALASFLVLGVSATVYKVSNVKN